MWVKCKRNGAIRFITKVSGRGIFLDDGKNSGKKPSEYCHFENYMPVYSYDNVKYNKMLSND